MIFQVLNTLKCDWVVIFSALIARQYVFDKKSIIKTRCTFISLNGRNTYRNVFFVLLPMGKGKWWKRNCFVVTNGIGLAGGQEQFHRFHEWFNSVIKKNIFACPLAHTKKKKNNSTYQWVGKRREQKLNRMRTNPKKTRNKQLSIRCKLPLQFFTCAHIYNLLSLEISSTWWIFHFKLLHHLVCSAGWLLQLICIKMIIWCLFQAIIRLGRFI